MTFKDSMLAHIIIFAWGLNFFVVIAFGLGEVPPLLVGGLRFFAVEAIECLLVKRPIFLRNGGVLKRSLSGTALTIHDNFGDGGQDNTPPLLLIIGLHFKPQRLLLEIPAQSWCFLF